MRTIKRIGVSSAFRVGFAVSAMAFLVIGFFVVLLPGLFGASLLFDNNFGGGFLGALVLYVVGVIAYGLFGGIGGALYAWVYNMAAGWMGGIEIELS
jgi:hypothetical protein